jgi:hypothetical protein
MPPRLYSLTCFVILLSLHCAAADATTQIKRTDPKKREMIRAALQADVVKGVTRGYVGLVPRAFADHSFGIRLALRSIKMGSR